MNPIEALIKAGTECADALQDPLNQRRKKAAPAVMDAKAEAWSNALGDYYLATTGNKWGIADAPQATESTEGQGELKI